MSHFTGISGQHGPQNTRGESVGQLQMTLVSRPPLKATQTFPFDMVDMCDVAIDGEGFRSRKKEQWERE
jgi:hypothetical protein